jgi:hypothetical protein
LYSYQRGARIHFHPSSFKLDYFPVIFDQAVLLLKMDDRIGNNIDRDSVKTSQNKLQKQNSKKDKCSLLNNFLSSKTTTNLTKSKEQQTSSTNVTCLTLLKQLFYKSSSNTVNETGETNVLTY